MNIDDKGRNFIYREEGVKLKAYRDQIGVPTIGVGFTFYLSGKKVQMTDLITLVECDALFKVMIKQYEDAVNNAVKVVLTQNQFNALVSFCYNVGTGGFSASTLVRKINIHSPLAEIEAEFNKWTKGGGKVLPVLVARRKREFALYNA